jgi:hypothetical protein
MPVHHGPVSEQDLTGIRNETRKIFVWGGADYIDIFGKKRFFRFFLQNGNEMPGKGWDLVPADKRHEAN